MSGVRTFFSIIMLFKTFFNLNLATMSYTLMKIINLFAIEKKKKIKVYYLLYCLIHL